jgi:uncharacterized protein (DUF3820 family)
MRKRIITFGPFKGQSYFDLPEWYLVFLIKQDWLREKDQEKCVAALDRLYNIKIKPAKSVSVRPKGRYYDKRTFKKKF